MKIKLSNAGKRFNREWVFRNLDLQINSNNSLAIIGPNGSGKSTLLQTIAGIIQLSEGSIFYEHSDSEIKIEEAYKTVSFCAPYLDLIEEMTLNEFFHFHHQFKPFQIAKEEIIAIIGLEKAADKQISNYSSGMKQRVKLAQAIFSQTNAVLLDEPCTNLDASGIDLYYSLVENYCKNRTLIISSNDELEYRFCQQRILISDYKKISA